MWGLLTAAAVAIQSGFVSNATDTITSGDISDYGWWCGPEAMFGALCPDNPYDVAENRVDQWATVGIAVVGIYLLSK